MNVIKPFCFTLLCYGLLILFSTRCKEKKRLLEIKNNHTELITQYFKLFNAHDWNNLANMYADTCMIKDPSDVRPTITKPEIIQKYTELQKIIPDVNDSIISVYDANPALIVEFISSGTGPDGKSFKMPICTIFEFDVDGKIIKDYTYYDNF